jgi:hypothetical protein
MKKIIPFLLLTLVLFSSCTKNNVVIPNSTITTDVLSSDWKYSSTTKTYYVNISMPELDQQSNATDGVLVSFSAGSDVYEAVPEVYNGDSYTFTHQPGSITLEVQSAGGTTINPPSYTIHVKIVLIPSH